jgi:competence protein ComEA
MNKNWYWLAAFIVIGILLGVGVLFLITRPPKGFPITLIPAPTTAPITIYISGKIMQPGLYRLPSGSRVNDAILAAGGFSEDANNEALNLAEILEDGEKVDVPGLQKPLSTESITRSVNPAIILVNINSAMVNELDSLPGIGPIIAQAIIDYRDANGPFKKIEDIVDVPRIGQVTFDNIKDLITVGTSP